MVRGAGGGVRHARLDTVGSTRVGRGPDALRLDGIYKDECGQEGPAVAVALAVYGGRETPARAMAQREHHGMWVIFHHGEKRSMIHVSLLLLDDEILVMYSQVQNSSGDPSDLGVATSGARVPHRARPGQGRVCACVPAGSCTAQLRRTSSATHALCTLRRIPTTSAARLGRGHSPPARDARFPVHASPCRWWVRQEASSALGRCLGCAAVGSVGLPRLWWLMTPPSRRRPFERRAPFDPSLLRRQHRRPSCCPQPASTASCYPQQLFFCRIRQDVSLKRGGRISRSGGGGPVANGHPSTCG